MNFLHLSLRAGILTGTFFFFVLAQTLHPQVLSTSSEQLYEKAYNHYINAELEEAYQIFYDLSEYYLQQEMWEELVDVIIYKSLIERSHREYEKAEDLINRAEVILDRYLEEDHVYYSMIYTGRAYLANEYNDFEEAVNWAEKSIEVVENHQGAEVHAVRSYSALGYMLDSQGDYLAAIDAYKKGVKAAVLISDEQKKNYAFTQVYNNLGVAYRRAGNPEKAMEYYEMNMIYQEKLFHSEHPEIAMSHNNMGAIYYAMGDIGRAAQYFLRAANILEKNYGRNHQLVAAAYNNAGTCYFRLEELDEAIRYLEMAQEIKVSLLGPDHLDTAIGHSNLASIYMSQEDYESALNNYNRSLTIRIENFGDDHPNLISPYMQRGKLYLEMNDPYKALYDYQKVLRIVRARLGDFHPNMAEVFIQIGHAQKAINEYSAALSSYQQAIIRLAENFDRTNIHENPKELTSTHPMLFLLSLAAKADLMNEYYLLNRDQDYLDTAYNSYQLSIRLIEDLQMKFQHEASKLNLFGENISIFEGAMLSAYNLHQLTGRREYLEAAFTIAEQSKARIANELLHESWSREFAGVPEDIMDDEREINSRITSLHQKLTLEKEKGDEQDEQIVRELQNSLFDAHVEQRNWIDMLEEEYPSYYEMKYNRNILGLDTVQNGLLDEEQVVMNYIFGEKYLFVLIISQRDVSIHQLEPDDLSGAVQNLRLALNERDYDKYKIEASGLYQQLIGPVEDRISGYRDLLFIPDHVLHYLPFELLLSESVDNNRPHEWPYLIRDYHVSYIPSLMVYDKIRSGRTFNPNRMLTIAPYIEGSDPVYADSGLRNYVSVLPPLPITRYETEQIARLFQSQKKFWNVFTPRKEVTFLWNQEATVQNLKEIDLTDYGYLHFATHAFVHETNPELSAIMLADNGSAVDVIYLNDIFNMRINADLVVLSACETGLGPLARGEGMVGFTRAFINSGAMNLVVSMWKVGDRSTSELMIHFYRELFNGISKTEALRRAKLSLIERPETAFPSEWASFILIGR